LKKNRIAEEFSGKIRTTPFGARVLAVPVYADGRQEPFDS
jgi:hypothetical protein